MTSLFNTNMAPTKSSNVKSGIPKESTTKSHKKIINDTVERVLQSRKNANDIFDLLEYLQVMM